MVIENTYPNLSNIVQTDFELDRVIQTVAAVDPGITGHLPRSTGRNYQCGRFYLYYKSVIAHVETALEIAQKLKSTQLRASDNAGSSHFFPPLSLLWLYCLYVETFMRI